MNFGKTAYLKVLDVEKELKALKHPGQNLNYYEFNKPNIDTDISTNNSFSLQLDNICVTKNKSIYFQIKVNLISNIHSEVDFDLIINDCIIHSETSNAFNYQTDAIILKTYSPITSGEVNVKLKISTNTDSAVVTIKNITTIIIGANKEKVVNGIELRALENTHLNHVIVSYIDNDELYYTNTSINEKSLRSEDFNFLLPAKSHCFCHTTYPCAENQDPDVLLYRVDINNNLYFSKIFNNEEEKLIDNNVEAVFASPCPQVSDDINIITYIKDGCCYYRTLRESGMTAAKKLPLPTGKYIDVRVISSPESEHLYIIACHENGSNYMLHSLIEVSTNKITEFISANYSVLISRYIDLSLPNKLSIENININASLLVESKSYLSEIIENLSKENIKVNFNLQAEAYKLQSQTIYGVSLDKSILTGLTWGSYTDDAVGFEGAYMDFVKDQFIDNGWKDRWPYNAIKPCLLKNGTVVGYLNPDDYTKFEDGRNSNIGSTESGQVMIEIPKIYYNITRDEDYINVKITDQKADNFVCQAHTYKGVELDKIYVSAYLCGTQSLNTAGFFTSSGSYLATNVGIGYETRYSLLKSMCGERYEFLPFNVIILIQCLYIIMFKNTNSQSSLGSGYTKEQSSYITGKLNTKGMYYGTTGWTGGVKFLGLEDIYGAKKQLSTGFYVDTNDMPRFIDPYDINSSYDPSYITNYITTNKPYVKGSKYQRTAIDINEDANNIGFFASSNSTDKNIGFCDSTALLSTVTSCCDYGVSGSQYANGIFAQSTVTANTSNTTRSTRLVYYP